MRVLRLSVFPWRVATFSLLSSSGQFLWSTSFNIFINDVNYSTEFSSLLLCAYDATKYAAPESPVVLESTLNQDIM